MIKKTFTCINCPIGCELTAEKDGEEIKVTGNTCRRGEEYAISEMTAPKRILTTTVRADDGSLIPVRTRTAIPKEKLFDAMKETELLRITLPVKAGDVVLGSIVGTGVDLIASVSRN